MFYIVFCTSDENDRGIFHYSRPFITENKATEFAIKTREKLKDEGHVAIEKHYEIFEHYEWRTTNWIHIDYL